MVLLNEWSGEGDDTPPAKADPKSKPKAGKGGKPKCVDLKPKLDHSEGLDEVSRLPIRGRPIPKPITQIDYLIRLGLGNPERITWYRQVIKDPARAMTNPTLRPYFVELLNTLFNLIFSDATLYNRLRIILMKQDFPRGREDEPWSEELVLEEDIHMITEKRFHIKYHDGIKDKELVVQGADKNDATSRLKRRNKVQTISAVKPVSEEAWPFHYYAVKGGKHTNHKYGLVKEGGPHKSYVTARAKAIQHSHIHGGETVHVYRSDGHDLQHSSSHRVGIGEVEDHQSKIHLFSLEGSGLGEEYGAGFIGTDEVVDNYGKATPGEHDLLARIKAALKKGKK